MSQPLGQERCVDTRPLSSTNRCNTMQARAKRERLCCITVICTRHKQRWSGKRVRALGGCFDATVQHVHVVGQRVRAGNLRWQQQQPHLRSVLRTATAEPAALCAAQNTRSPGTQPQTTPPPRLHPPASLLHHTHAGTIPQQHPPPLPTIHETAVCACGADLLRSLLLGQA